MLMTKVVHKPVNLYFCKDYYFNNNELTSFYKLMTKSFNEKSEYLFG